MAGCRRRSLLFGSRSVAKLVVTEFGWKRSEGRRKEVRDGAVTALFPLLPLGETLPRRRVLLLRLCRSISLCATRSFVFKRFGFIYLFILKIRACLAECSCWLAPTRSRSLAQESKGSSCCVTGSLEFGSLSGGNASVPCVKHPLNTTGIDLRP